MSEWDAKLNSKNEEIEKLRKELQGAHIDKNRAEQQSSDISKARSELMRELQSAEEKIANHDKLLAKHLKQTESSQNTLMSVTAQLDASKEEVQSLQKLLGLQDERNKTLETRLSRSSSQADETAKLFTTQLTTQEETLSSISKDKSSLEADLKRQTESNTILQERVVKLQNELQSCQSELEQVHEMHNRKTQELIEDYEASTRAKDIELVQLKRTEQELTFKVRSLSLRF